MMISIKLDASLAKIDEVVKRASPFMKLTLYVAGHTDTVGGTTKNRKLSLERAIAIGRYLGNKQRAITIASPGLARRSRRSRRPTRPINPRIAAPTT